MTKPMPYQVFGDLLTEGIKQTGLTRRETMQQTHQYLADELGYAVNTLYVWRRGEHLPDNPATVASLARIFAQTWHANQKWINHFLEKGEYGPPQAVESLNQELFGLPAPATASLTTPQPTEPLANFTPGPISQPVRSSTYPIATAVLNFLTIILFKFLELAPDSLSSGLLDRLGRPKPPPAAGEINFFPATCGGRGIELAEQRLLVSTAFGTYFAGLLERQEIYLNLAGQISVQAGFGQAGLEPLQRLYWALQAPRGPRLVVIAAEGGMGKSTLAAKLVRCLFEENAVDMILGDSAKSQLVNPTSGEVASLSPGYYDPAGFFERLYAQLGLPAEAGPARSGPAIRFIRDRLEGRRAVILVDNLETVSRGMELLTILHQLAARDVRVIVTTRTVTGLTHPADLLLVQLNSLQQLESARDFLRWHIQRYAAEQPDLRRLEPDLLQPARLHPLIKHTGGIPLLMQLVLSDVARFSWPHVDHLPQLFGAELLNFLYRQRWDELGQLGQPGQQARQLLQFVSAEQYRGQTITFDRLAQWAASGEMLPQPALTLLHERFLLVNYDVRRGNFAVFPSLTEFLNQQAGETRG